MKRTIFILAGIYAMALTSCSEQKSSNTADSAKVAADTLINADAKTQSAESVASKFLTTTYEDDLKKDLIDSASRNYQLSEADLNNDGKSELLIGLQGPYFCGSGGCTIYLLDSSGTLITRFTVTDYPITIDQSDTNGWHNLVLGSRGKYHLMKFNGKTYPANPSIEAEISLSKITVLAEVLRQEDRKLQLTDFNDM